MRTGVILVMIGVGLAGCADRSRERQAVEPLQPPPVRVVQQPALVSPAVPPQRAGGSAPAPAPSTPRLTTPTPVPARQDSAIPPTPGMQSVRRDVSVKTYLPLPEPPPAIRVPVIPVRQPEHSANGSAAIASQPERRTAFENYLRWLGLAEGLRKEMRDENYRRSIGSVSAIGALAISGDAQSEAALQRLTLSRMVQGAETAGRFRRAVLASRRRADFAVPPEARRLDELYMAMLAVEADTYPALANALRRGDTARYKAILVETGTRSKQLGIEANRELDRLRR